MRDRRRWVAGRAGIATLMAALLVAAPGMAAARKVPGARFAHTQGAGTEPPPTSGGSSSAAAGTTSGPPAVPRLPQPPTAMNEASVVDGSRLAPYVLPIHLRHQVSLASSSTIDTVAMPPTLLEQRTYASSRQQWLKQGAQAVSPGVTIPIDPAAFQAESVSTGQPGLKTITQGSLAGNRQAAVGWPTSVHWVQYRFQVRVPGVYQLKLGYYVYPTCYSAQATTEKSFTQNVHSTNGPWCGRGTAAVRSVQIDPPGTVPTVSASAPPPQVSARVAAAAHSAHLSLSQLPGWINPLKAYVPVAPSPAWALPDTAHPQANPCALRLVSPTGPTGYDGYQFQEARQVGFSGLWTWTGMAVDAKTGYASFRKDNQGDNLYPIPTEMEKWQTAAVRDLEGTYRNPLEFCLPSGTHVLRLGMVREPMAISSIVFQGPPLLPSYLQYEARWQRRGLQPVACGMCVQVQAEAPWRESSSSVNPGSTSYPSVVPHTNGYYILNDINGNYWQLPGKTITYRVTVPHSGFYKVGFKVLQAGMQGLPASRVLRVDGRVPFDGAQWVAIPFQNAWEMTTLSQPNGKPALLALTKGVHYISLSTTLGMVGQVLTTIQQITERMGELQREIIMITGPNPNPNVDYGLAENVPDLIPQLQAVVGVLREQAAILTYDAGGVSPVAANSINITANDIEQMAAHPHQIKLDMLRWQQDDAALASWITQLQAQPVSMDWFALAGPSYRLPSAGAGFVQQVLSSWDNFIISFYRNYSGVGSRYRQGITIWVGYGQTWAEIMSQMAQSEFTPATGIHVNFDVIPGGAHIVLLSEVAGHGPDLATGMPPDSPVDYALRKGARNFAAFPHWNVVRQRFIPQALIPYTFTNAHHQAGVYGVPETQGMSLLFFRKDIMQSLHLAVPQTWPELYKELPVLATHGMEFYYAGLGSAGLTPFLYQNGGSFYHNTARGIRANLDTPQGYLAFKQWTELYTHWQVPLAANIFTRFQTGQVPLAIGGYGEYIKLSVAAPQLAGLWGIATIPATAYQCGASGCTRVQSGPCAFPTSISQPDQPGLPPGTHCRWNDSSGDLAGESAVMLMPRSAKPPNEAWKFVEWWSSTPAQLEFAKDLEAIGGLQVAWNTANVQALRGLPWPESDLRVFSAAWQQYQPIPVVPGGYIANRYVHDIWVNVVVDGQKELPQLRWAVSNIDQELYMQEVQYGLSREQRHHIIVGS